MHNDPELNGKYLGTITADFIKVSDHLKEASYQMRERAISQFPIFPICKHPQAIGSMFIGRAEYKHETLIWNYYISMVEEFQQRGLVAAEEEEAWQLFKQNYSNPDEYCCLFVIDEEFTNFVFIPYPEDER